MKKRTLSLLIASCFGLAACEPMSGGQAGINCAPVAGSQQPDTPKPKSINTDQPETADTRTAQDADNGLTVAIDIGHDRVKPGAISARGHGEFIFNLKLAKLLKAELDRRGYDAFLINEKGDPIQLSERTLQASEGQADIMLSIHHDSAKERDLSAWTYKGRKLTHTDVHQGYSLFISKAKGWDNVKLGAAIGRGFNANNLTPTHYHSGSWDLINKDRGVYDRPKLTVLRTAEMPAVLIEAGVIKHIDEEEQLLTTAYQLKITDSISDGVDDFFSQSDLAKK